MHTVIQSLVEEFRRDLVADSPGLARVALTIARLEYEDLDAAAALASLDALAGTIQERLSPDARPEEQMAMINLCLFAEHKYRGNEKNYYDPRNSCLNAVLKRKLGIPITLSLLYIEIGRRLGLEVEGVAFPGHFLVRVRCDQGLVVIDPFNEGITLSEADVRSRLAQVQGAARAGPADLSEVLAPAGKREICVRILRNLKKIYMESGEADKAIGAISLILVADPEAAAEWRDRGLLYREIEAYRAALTDLSRYLELTAHGQDIGAIRHLVVELRGINARLN